MSSLFVKKNAQNRKKWNNFANFRGLQNKKKNKKKASKIGLGDGESLVSYFRNCILVHIMSQDANLVLTLVGLEQINMALVFDMEPKLRNILNIVANTISKTKT